MESDHNFGNTTAAELVWHMQKRPQIESLESPLAKMYIHKPNLCR